MLEQETVSLVCSDASTNFLDQLYGGLVPGVGGFNCHWQKDVRGREHAILLLLLQKLKFK